MKQYSKILYLLNRSIVFFLLMAAVISCCTILFVTLLANDMGVELTRENVELAAKATMGNIIFLSLVCAVIDLIRHTIMVDRPVKNIADAAEKIMQGNLDVRIEPHHSMDNHDGFLDVIHCFNQMAETLSQMDNLRMDFIANVSHELKTPLAAISNYGKILSGPNLSEEKRIQYGKAVNESAARLAELITNILRLNKLENQQILLKTEKYNLSEQLCLCLLEFEDCWEKKEIHIETDMKEDVMINSDPEMLSLVWNNLFSNAIKFTENGGTVKLSLWEEGGRAFVKVQDTGCGISKEEGIRIFDKFYQADTSRATSGNGLGLALVKRVIDLTGSEILVESESGVGTTFVVSIRQGAE